jgi:hypothetical protein
MTKVKGYNICVESAYSGVNYNRAQEIRKLFREKYNLDIYFPMETDTRHRFNIDKMRIPRSLRVLDGLLETLRVNHYNIKGIELVFEQG